MLPWSHCDNDWNTEECTRDHRKILAHNRSESNASSITWNSTGSSDGSYSVISSTVATLAAASNETKGIVKTYVADPVTEFWEYVLCLLQFIQLKTLVSVRLQLPFSIMYICVHTITTICFSLSMLLVFSGHIELSIFISDTKPHQ